MQEHLWVEKYRPSTLQDIILPSQLKKDFELAMELIKFKNIDLDDNMLECSSYNFCEELLKSSFEKLSFKSITEKSWESWINTFGALNNGKTAIIDRA